MPDRYRYDRDRAGFYGGRDPGRTDDVAGFRGTGYLGGDYGQARTDRDRGGGGGGRGCRDETPSYRGRGPKNYQRSDERIREDVCERLERDERVDASDLEVNVENGIV